MRIILSAIFVCVVGLIGCSQDVSTTQEQMPINPQDEEIVNPLYKNINPKDSTWLVLTMSHADLFCKLTGAKYSYDPPIYDAKKDKYSLGFKFWFPDTVTNNDTIVNVVITKYANFLSYLILNDSIHRFDSLKIQLFNLRKVLVKSTSFTIPGHARRIDTLSEVGRGKYLCTILPSTTTMKVDRDKRSVDIMVREDFLYVPEFSLMAYSAYLITAVSEFVLRDDRFHYQHANFILADSLGNIKQTDEFNLIEGVPMPK